MVVPGTEKAGGCPGKGNFGLDHKINFYLRFSGLETLSYPRGTLVIYLTLFGLCLPVRDTLG